MLLTCLVVSKEYVDLSYNFIAGTLPSAVWQFKRLTSLALIDNVLEGTLPSEIGTLTQLLGLRLGDNFLSGTIPTEYGDLTLLTDLHIKNTFIEGSIPSELGRLRNLGKLFLFSPPTQCLQKLIVFGCPGEQHCSIWTIVHWLVVSLLRLCP